MSLAIRRRTAVILVALVVLFACIVLGAKSVSALSDDPLPIPEVTADEANERAAEILSRSEYQPPPESFAEKVANWIGERIGDVLNDMVSGSASSVVGLVVIVVLLGLVALMIWRIVRTMSPVTHRNVDQGIGLEIEVPRSPDEWRSEAEGHEATGNWKAALLCRYRALIAELVQRGVLHSIPGRTTGEYRMDIRADQPVVAEEFSAASDLFDDVWYGDLQTGFDDNARFRDLSDRVVRGVSR